MADLPPLSLSDQLMVAIVTRICNDVITDRDYCDLEMAELLKTMPDVTREHAYLTVIAEQADALLIAWGPVGRRGKDLNVEMWRNAKMAARIELNRFWRWRTGRIVGALLAREVAA